MLDLFVLETCPYCKKVMAFMDETGMKYNKVDIKNKAAEDTLIQLGGKRQVPFLVDRDRNLQMYESDDIIPLVREMFEFIRTFEGDVPGAAPNECGNYLDMNLPMAKFLADKYLEEVLSNMTLDRMKY